MHCCVHERERVCVYVHACVWVRMYDVYICLYAVVCVCERERERERESMCVCVHACVCVRVYAVYMFICRVVCVREKVCVCACWSVS